MSGGSSELFDNRYTDKELIGEGSFGQVYHAYDRDGNCDVAIKIPRPGLLADTEKVQTFFNEAKRLRKLRHPNIIALYHWGNFQGAPYLVMEYVKGETLKQRLEKGRLNLEDTVRIISQVGAALAYANRPGTGIVHLDLKPDNILISNDETLIKVGEEVKVSDFGFARVLDPDATGTTNSSIVDGGTPRYMAPERRAGPDPIPTAAADQFSLAAIAYEMLCGQAAFPQEHEAPLLDAKLHGRIGKLSDLGCSVPPRVEDAILRALNPSPELRFPSVKEFCDELKKEVEEKSALIPPDAVAPAPEQPASDKNHVRKDVAVVVGVLTVLVIVLAGYLWPPLKDFVDRMANAISVVLTLGAGLGAGAITYLVQRQAPADQEKNIRKWVWGVIGVLLATTAVLVVQLVWQSIAPSPPTPAATEPPGTQPAVTAAPTPVEILPAIAAFQNVEKSLLAEPASVTEAQMTDVAAGAALEYLHSIQRRLIDEGFTINRVIEGSDEPIAGWLDATQVFVYERQQGTEAIYDLTQDNQLLSEKPRNVEVYYYLEQVDGVWKVTSIRTEE